MTKEERQMDYKEKLEEAKRLYESANDVQKHIIENLFSELKESEEERIRKEIIKFLELPHPQFVGKRHQEEWIAWLEKQGKQKSTGHNENEEPQVYETNDGDVVTYSETNGYKVIEPKFKVGDWISNDMCDVHIASIENGMYYFDEGDGLSIVFVDEHYHIWTIEDAIDGDVLFHSDSASNGIFIFKEILHRGTIQEVICYCDYDSEDGFCLGEKHTCCWTDAKILHPATKEQRDFLFSKIKEAGYEFDFETKELKKIENDLTEFENALADVCRGWIGEELGWKDYIIKNSLPLLEFAKKQFDEYEQKPAWSEEDEKRLNFCLNILRPKTLFGNTEISNIDTINTKWLKSLKDRIQPHKQWKPSEEQIKAFEHFVRSIGESGYASLYENNTKLLYSLLEQLKKL